MITVAAPILYGLSETMPKKDSGKWSLVLAGIGVAAGATGIYLAHKGDVDKALQADAVSVLFDVLAIKKALDTV